MSPSISPAPALAPRIGEPGAGGTGRPLETREDAVPRAGEAGLRCCAVLLLADIRPGLHRLWGWSRFVRGPGGLRAWVPGLRFAKILGSGYEGGFGLRQSASRQGLFALFDDPGSAADFLDRSPVVQAYRGHAREFCQLELHPYASRGSWSGQAIAASVPAPVQGPVAALTRASIRPSQAARFWRHAPPSQRALERAQGCRLAVGLGEAPLLRQATFSLWDSTAAMDAYARSGAHLEAIRAAWREEYFSESLFARFVPARVQGAWKDLSHG